MLFVLCFSYAYFKANNKSILFVIYSMAWPTFLTG